MKKLSPFPCCFKNKTTWLGFKTKTPLGLKHSFNNADITSVDELEESWHFNTLLKYFSLGLTQTILTSQPLKPSKF